MIDRQHALPITHQAKLLKVSVNGFHFPFKSGVGSLSIAFSG